MLPLVFVLVQGHTQVEVLPLAWKIWIFSKRGFWGSAAARRDIDPHSPRKRENLYPLHVWRTRAFDGWNSFEKRMMYLLINYCWGLEFTVEYVERLQRKKSCFFNVLSTIRIIIGVCSLLMSAFWFILGEESSNSSWCFCRIWKVLSGSPGVYIRELWSSLFSLLSIFFVYFLNFDPQRSSVLLIQTCECYRLTPSVIHLQAVLQ